MCIRDRLYVASWEDASELQTLLDLASVYFIVLAAPPFVSPFSISSTFLRLPYFSGVFLGTGETFTPRPLLSSYASHFSHKYIEHFVKTGDILIVSIVKAIIIPFSCYIYIYILSLIHISEPTRLLSISYAVFCL